jgi:hypothetical protein
MAIFVCALDPGFLCADILHGDGLKNSFLSCSISSVNEQLFRLFFLEDFKSFYCVKLYIQLCGKKITFLLLRSKTGRKKRETVTINVPLFKKLRDIIFFCGTITL